MEFLYNFDIIGPNPELYIFKNKRYKSLLSLLFSVLIILFSIVFILYSFIIYFKFDRPIITYSKSNDKNEFRQIYLKDALMMFQYIDTSTFRKIKESIIQFEVLYEAIFYNGTTENIKLKVENCELGKNLNSKYSSYLKERSSELTSDISLPDKNIEDFYCINSDKNDISLFYQPDIGFSSINLYFIYKNNNDYSPERIEVMFIYENNLINHENKTSPISEGISYEFLKGFSLKEYSIIDFIFQYLKYETDDGLFLDSLHNLYGMSFLETTYYKSNQISDKKEKGHGDNSTVIGELSLYLNKSNYDYFRRSYKKIQTLLAEISSIISLLMEIGRQILSILNEKRMSVDIVRKLYMVDNNIINRNGKLSRHFKNDYSDRIKIAPDKMNNSFHLIDKNSSTLSNDFNNKKKIIFENKHEIVLKSINIYNILKSFIGNSYKDKLINLCHDIIIDNMCIEKILEKFYNLGRIYKSILKEERYNLGLNKEQKFREINSIIYSLYNKINTRNKKINIELI